MEIQRFNDNLGQSRTTLKTEAWNKVCRFIGKKAYWPKVLV